MLEEIYVKALLAYVEMLEIHIDTKNWSEPFHRKTWDFYELLFSIAHDIWERNVDLWWTIRKDHGNCVNQSVRVIKILTSLKEELESIEWVSKWTENLLYSHIDKLEWAIWSATWFIKEKEMMNAEVEEVEVKEEISEPKEDWITVVEIETNEPLENVIEL